MSEGIITRRASDIRPLLLDRFRNAAAAYSLRPLTLSGQDNPVVKVRRSVDDTEQDFNPAQINDGTLEQFVNAGDVAPADYGTGAAAAYSLRHVSDGYTGDVIRVRESTNNTEQDFNPTEITDGTLLAFCGAGDGLVTKIYDQSGNGNDYTQPTATIQGVLVSSGSLNLLNGKPVILRSADDNGGYLSNYAPNDGADPKMYFYVGKNGNNNACIFGSRIGAGDYGYFSQSGSSSTFVNNFVVAANEKLNNQALSYTTRDDFYQETVNQFLLSADITFNFSNNEKTLGYRFNNVANFGMFAFQEEIIYLNDASINRELIETNVNHYYSIYSQTNDGFVTTWYDQSGNGNDATQSTAGSQPKIVNAGSLVVENGKAALDFDGGNQHFLTQDYTVELSQNDATVYAVIKQDVSKGYVLAEGDTVSPYSSNFILGGSDGTNVLWVNTTTFGTLGLAQSLIGFIYDGSVFQAYLNGNTSGSSSGATVNQEVSGQAAIGAFADGSVAEYNGKIQEIITYKSDQSSTRQQIESNINNHYGIY